MRCAPYLAKAAIFTLLLFAININVFSQNLPRNYKTGKTSYIENVKMPNSTKAKIYAKAKRWIRARYSQSYAFWQQQDSEKGLLQIRVKMQTEIDYFIGKVEGGDVFYTITVRCSENAFECEFTDFYHDGQDSDNKSGGALETEITENNKYAMPPLWNDIKLDVNKKIILIKAEFIEYMKI